jgi:CRISPR-associated endonuclease/helicase Cas3
MSVDFPTVFETLTGHAPFRWQARLYDELLAGKRYDACDIPTGLGKTSIMAIWLIALAAQAARGAPSLPRRLVYVVDRRTVVDQATDVAEKIRGALREVAPGSPTANLRDILSGLCTDAHDEASPLAISTLRGELADNREWQADPARPAMIIGTVDMIGSRLLFSGYGVSPKMRPMHAGLLGADSLTVLDEAHLVPPFEALIRRVAEYAASDSRQAPFDVPAMRAMALSATGREGTLPPFTLTEEDDADPPVRNRLDATKRLKLEREVGAGDLAAALATRAWERGEGGRRVLVFCNSRKAAGAVYEILAAKLRNTLKERFGRKSIELDRFLQMIVGARRVREREVLAGSIVFRRFAHKLTEEERAAQGDMPAFLVATSAGEVGVDLDAEHMVCDLVPWERMVQRLGRVNRLGEFTQGSLIDVFPSASDKKDKEAEIAIEDANLERWREPFEYPAWRRDGEERLDASPGALRRLRAEPEFKKRADAATTPEPLRPALTRPLIEAWSMTSLEEHAGRPDVEPWIRGWIEDDRPQSTVLLAANSAGT